MNTEFLLNNTFHCPELSTNNEIVDVKMTSIEHYYGPYYIAYFYYIENGVEKLEYMHDGGLYVEGDYAYLYRSIEEAQNFELSYAITKIKIN